VPVSERRSRCGAAPGRWLRCDPGPGVLLGQGAERDEVRDVGRGKAQQRRRVDVTPADASAEVEARAALSRVACTAGPDDLSRVHRVAGTDVDARQEGVRGLQPPGIGRAGMGQRDEPVAGDHAGEGHDPVCRCTDRRTGGHADVETPMPRGVPAGGFLEPPHHRPGHRGRQQHAAGWYGGPREQDDGQRQGEEGGKATWSGPRGWGVHRAVLVSRSARARCTRKTPRATGGRRRKCRVGSDCREGPPFRRVGMRRRIQMMCKK
jgi:hypothetical protein